MTSVISKISYETVSLVFGIIATASCSYLVVRVARSSSFPRSGKNPFWTGLAAAKRDFVANGARIIEQGYRRHKDGVFCIQTADMERLVVSPKYLNELKSVPEDTLSLRKGMAQRHLGNYTKLDIILTSHLQSDVCKINLTQNLSSLISPINDETNYWLDQKISPSALPVEIKAYETVLRIVAGISSRVFVGLPISRDDKWLDTAMNYTLDVFYVSMALRPYPAFMRGFVAPWLDCTKRLNGHIQTASDSFGHIFAERLAQTGGEKPNDMFQWMVDSAVGADRNPEILVRKMLFLTLAAVHTSTMSATHALFDLCAHPEYAEPLRMELNEVLAEHGWSLAAINKLKLLDSFLKESQRVNHPGLLSFNRRVMKSIPLSDGTTIPSGSFICMATNSIAQDSELYPEPEHFDGFRFHKMRMASESEASKHLFVSTGSDNLAFGHGKFACPGRHFAGAQIKVILANILLKYDVSFPKGQTERPANTFSGESIGPSRAQTIVFKSRS